MNVEVQDQASIIEPFPGPRPFASSESALFKGREKESRDVRDLILSYQVVVLYGKSGTGKSSLVNAGLRPLLIAEGFGILPVVRVGGKIPPQIDQSKVKNVFSFNALSTCAGVTTDPASLIDAQLSQYLGKTSETSHILVLDQFEELFTAFPDRWQDRKPFFLELQKLCQSNKHLRLLLVIREDQLAELDAYADLLPNDLRIRYRLERLREEEALQAVVLPVSLAGYTFEEGVDRELVANLRIIYIQTENGTKEVVGEFVEPVHLQVVCRNLWNNRPKETRLLTSSEVRKFADVSQSLAAFYAQAVRAASAQTKVREGKIRVWIEENLITPGGTRGIVYMGNTSTEGLPNEAVRVLEQEHVIAGESRAGALWYELTHDRFIGPIRSSNRPWFAKRRRTKYIAWTFAACLFLIVVSFPVYFRIQQRAIQRHIHQDEADADQAEHEMRQGKDEVNERNWDEAIKHYSAALDLYTRLGARGGQAEAYVRIGNAYTWKNQWLEAASNYKKALEIHRSSGEDSAVGNDLKLIGDALTNGSDYASAISYYNAALTAYQKVTPEEGPASQGQTPREPGDAFRQLNNDKSPEDTRAKQAEILRESAEAYRWLGDYKNSEDCIKHALELYSQLKPRQPAEEAVAKFYLANLYNDRGEYDRAIPLFKEVRKAFLKNGNFADASTAAVNFGSSLLAAGKKADAWQAFEQALSEFETRGDKSGMGLALAKIAEWYVDQKLCGKALESANQALKFGEQSNDGSEVRMAHRFRARANLCANMLQDAATEAEEALEASRVDRFEQAYNLETIALVAAAKGDLTGAIENGQKSVALWDSMGSRTVHARTARANLIRWQKATKVEGLKRKDRK